MHVYCKKKPEMQLTAMYNQLFKRGDMQHTSHIYS